MRNKTRTLALLGLSVALAMILSYIEFLLPPIFAAVPGIKIGLANIVIIFLLYKLDFKSALAVSLVRVGLSSLLFGTALTFIYSLSGALLSIFLMLLFKRLGWFSCVGVSIVGGVSHNLGQILAAALILRTREIIYYMAVLAVSGTLAGVLIGVSAAFLIKRINLSRK